MPAAEDPSKYPYPTSKHQSYCRLIYPSPKCVPDPLNKFGPCITCKMATETALTRPLCVRKKVTDARIFAEGSHPQFRWTQRWKHMKIVEITEWASKEVKTIRLTQDVGNLSYPLRVRQFIPKKGDSLQREWSTRGKPNAFKCAPYAIENMKQTSGELAAFVERSIEPSITYYIDDSDWLLNSTYRMALQYSAKLDVSPLPVPSHTCPENANGLSSGKMNATSSSQHCRYGWRYE